MHDKMSNEILNVVNAVNFADICMILRQSVQSLNMHGRHLHDVYVNRAMPAKYS